MAGGAAVQTSPAALALAQPATLFLRPWLHEFTPVSWTGSQPWIAMLRDAITCSGGETSQAVSAEDGILAATFTKTSLAMAASRRLHALVAGYSVESEGKLSCVSLLIAPTEIPDIASLAQHLYRKGQPAQTLLVIAQGTPILSSTKLEDIVPFGLEVHELPYAQQPQASEAAKQLLRTHEDRSTMAQPTPDSRPPFLAALESVASWLQQMVIRFPKYAITGVALVAILGGVLILHRPAKQRSSPVTSNLPAPVNVRQPVIAPTIEVRQAPPQKPVAPSKKLPSPDPVKIVEKSSHGRGDLTPEQIRQILTRGQSALDQGCYTEASGYYRRVLDDDPRNATATNGLNKVRVRMKLTDENAICSR